MVWVNGPFGGGEHDKNIYDSALKHKIPDGKKIIVYREYEKKAKPVDHKKLGLPNPNDMKHVNNFKSRLRLRHETFNGRI